MRQLRDLHTSKYKRPRNKPNDGCLWKPAKRNSVRTSKQLRFVAITETYNGNQALMVGMRRMINIAVLHRLRQLVYGSTNNQFLMLQITVRVRQFFGNFASLHYNDYDQVRYKDRDRAFQHTRSCLLTGCRRVHLRLLVFVGNTQYAVTIDQDRQEL